MDEAQWHRRTMAGEPGRRFVARSGTQCECGYKETDAPLRIWGEKRVWGNKRRTSGQWSVGSPQSDATV